MIINLQKLRAAPSKQGELEVERAWAAEKRFGRIARGSVDWILAQQPSLIGLRSSRRLEI